ncbi:hypothetical protein WDZ92_37445 [Nostoc sp. NIES-2111]
MAAGEVRKELPGKERSALTPDDTDKPPDRTGNVLLAHWRGEFPPYSYAQGAIVLATLAALCLLHFAVPYPVVFRAGPLVTLFALRALIVVVPIYGWLLVGLWRSGSVYARERAASGESTRNGREIQILVALAVLLLIWDVVEHFPFLYCLCVYLYVP